MMCHFFISYQRNVVAYEFVGTKFIDVKDVYAYYMLYNFSGNRIPKDMPGTKELEF